MQTERDGTRVRTAEPAFVPSPRRRLWLPPLLIYAFFSLVSATFLAIGGAYQVQVLGDEPGYHSSSPMKGSPGYWGVLTNWDGQWFRSIAENGYPVPLPMEDGAVAQNEWAFLPLYPLMVRALMAVTSLPFHVCAWFLSVSFGALAVVVIYRLVLSRVGKFNAGAVIVGLCSFPTAPVFQVAYTESLALFLVAGAIAALERRRYVVVLLAALCLALTRPIVLPLAVVVAIHGVARLRAEGAEFAVRERWIVALAAVVSAALFGLWPAVAEIVTGHSNAYLETQGAWPTNERSSGGWFTTIVGGGPVGLTALAGLLWVVLLAVRRGARRWGVELRAWGLVYPLFLLAATRPGPSIFRYFMLSVAPMWPILQDTYAGTVGRRRLKLRWAALLLVLAIQLPLQYQWTTNVFTFSTSAAEVWFP